MDHAGTGVGRDVRIGQHAESAVLAFL
jgi:hypothetical protein